MRWGSRSNPPTVPYSLDIAAFHIDWEDIQLFARSEQFRRQHQRRRVPQRWRRIHGTRVLADGIQRVVERRLYGCRAEDDTPALSGGLKGDALPYTPEWSASAERRLRVVGGRSGDGYVGGSLRYLSDQTGAYDLAFRTANGRQREIESYEVLDLQAGVDFGRWSIELYGRTSRTAMADSTGALGAAPHGALGPA